MTREKIDGLETWVTAFLRDCKIRGLSAFTVEFYRAQLQIFTVYCKGEGVTEVLTLTPDLLRGFLLLLETQGRNEGGRHAAFRAVRAFLRWYEVETEPEAWTISTRIRLLVCMNALSPLKPDAWRKDLNGITRQNTALG